MKASDVTRKVEGIPPPILQWKEKFQAITNEDVELQAHGAHYSCSFMLDMGEFRVVIEVHRGKIVDIVFNPGDLDKRYQFAIRASPETWSKFAVPTPDPMYHGIWAATFRRDMKLEGDILVLMQNLREITRHLELLRSTGLPLNTQVGRS